MDQLHEADEAVDKLLTEADHLARVAGDDGITPDRLELALAVAKRVRRASTMCVQALARTRDQLQP